MAGNPFDAVFENKLIFDKKDLFKKAKIEKVDSSKTEDKVNETVLSEEELKVLVNLYNNDLKDSFTKEEIQVLNNTLEAQKEEAKEVMGDIQNLKKDILDQIRHKGDAFTLNISKRSHLKKLTIEVFNEEKEEITAEDYFTLLELRKELIKQEAEALLESSIDNVQ